jgi:Ca2+-binding RTX toxin-like protein
MAKKTISEDTNEQWIIQGDNSTWTLEKDASIVLAENYAIKIGNNSNGNTVRVLGDVLNVGSNHEGIGVFGDDTTIVIGNHSEINAGGDGMYMAADNARVVNKGSIHGQVSGLISEHGADIRNSGEIVGQSFGINASGLGTHIFNDAGATISGSAFGIILFDVADFRIVNHGTISGGAYAITVDGSGSNRLINTGTIEGNVLFGVGNDLIDTRNGTVTGTIDGGDGNDRYKIGSWDQLIVEDAGHGHDIVHSTASFALPDNVEALVLIGNIGGDAAGNDDDNAITGNKAQNTISGGLGDDTIGGAAGDDFLAGEGGADTFIFGKGADHDAIFDFQNGLDKIRMKGFAGIDEFDALSSHISQHGSDVWISMGNGDRLVLNDTSVAQLDETDFSF